MKDIDDLEELSDEDIEPVPGGGREPDLPPGGGGGGEPDIPPDDERTEPERTIDAKRRQLKRSGRGLGSPRTGVQDAGHGGRVQTFERGRIYWHPATGAHEVHGGILRAYLERGGPDRNPETGRRDLKFPTSDEGRAADGRTPVSRFEAGSIYWVDGVGGVAIHGEIEAQWRQMGAEQSRLGLPLSDPRERDGVDVVFFERGCLWTGPGSDGRVLSYRFNARPLDGRQTIVDPDDPETLSFPSPLVTNVPDATVPDVEVNAVAKRRVDGPDGPNDPDDPGHGGPTGPPIDPDDLEAVDPEIARRVGASGQAIWRDVLVLTAVDGGIPSVPLSVSYGGATLVDLDGTVMFRHDLRIDDPSRLEPGTPYDVRLTLPDGRRYRLFTDAVLVRSDASAERSDIVFVDDVIDVVGRVRLRRRRDNPETLLLDTEEGTVVLGGDERDGDIRIRDGTGTERIHLDTGAPKTVDNEHVRVYVDGHEGTLLLGGDGVSGTVTVRDGDGNERLVIDGDTGDVRLDFAGDGTTESLGARIGELERRITDLEG